MDKISFGTQLPQPCTDVSVNGDQRHTLARSGMAMGGILDYLLKLVKAKDFGG